MQQLANVKNKIKNREGVNKKIVRFFKKFLKASIKSKLINFKSLMNPDKQGSFWIKFAYENVFPPCVIDHSDGSKQEFKSFNENYISYLFSQDKGTELYSLMLSNSRTELVSCVAKGEKLLLSLRGVESIEEYVNCFPYLYSNFASYHHPFSEFVQNPSECFNQGLDIQHKQENTKSCKKEEEEVLNIMTEIIEMRKEYMSSLINNNISKLQETDTREEFIVTVK